LTYPGGKFQLNDHLCLSINVKAWLEFITTCRQGESMIFESQVDC
jgi:hypothetical protein